MRNSNNNTSVVPPWLAEGTPAERLRAADSRFGFLSGIVNGVTTVCGIAIVAAVANFAPVHERYPLELTVRPVEKRPLLLLTASGEPFARRGDCTATPVRLEELPRHLIDAVLSMEDRRFHGHFGLDPKGLTRATVRNLEAGRVVEGGSTITQQLVKNAYLSSARTMDRKFEEALLSLWLEFRLGKRQILERYLSSVYFGEGCHGVRAAAKHYFDKEVGDLTVAESALLVALLRSPTRLAGNLENARRRARLVLGAMARDGRLDAKLAASIAIAKPRPERSEELGAYYADWLADSLRLEDPRSRQTLWVYTSFEPELQLAAEKAVREVLEKEGRDRRAGQAAMVVMRPDGRVLAMVGGRDRADSQFNRAVQARRQPGSSFKTFVYLAALRVGARADMTVVDEPVDLGGWEPRNFGERFRGHVTLTQAFASSINTVAVKVSEAIGRDAVIAAARDLGIRSPLQPFASVALGAQEVNLLEMTSAYAAIAAGAYPVVPWGATGLGDFPADGGRPPVGAGAWKLEQAPAMRELLSAVVRFGSGRAAGLPVATYGKTGTSQEFRDAWFIGFAGNLVVGVWVGNDDDTPMNRVTGGNLPARMWRAFMREAMEVDRDFERKLSRVESFEAKSPRMPDRSLRMASLESMIASAGRPEGQAATSRHARSWRDGPYLLAPPRAYREAPRRQAPASGGRSGDFNRQLRAMGWPGMN